MPDPNPVPPLTWAEIFARTTEAERLDILIAMLEELRDRLAQKKANAWL